MKIQIDTTAKTLKLDEPVKIGELISALDKLFPLDAWKDFQLITNIVINWQPNPIIIREYPQWPVYPTYPWWQQPIYTTTGITCELNPGIYDVQI